MTWEKHENAMRRLRRVGVGGYVVLSEFAGQQGLDTRFPIGKIVAFVDPITCLVRKLGQRGTSAYAAGFWQPAPKQLLDYLTRRRRSTRNV